jgi:ABC-type antimicrobial peptide transport system permease subunit
VETLRRTLQGLAPDLPAVTVTPIRSLLDWLFAPLRVGAVAFTGLGVLATVIAVLGLAGVLSFLVSQRRRDFAIRSALGARPDQIVWPVLRQALAIVAAGALAGVAGARLAAPWLQPQLFHTRLVEPAVVSLLLAILLATALAAAFGPARRAGACDPMDVLRAQ